MKLRNAFTMTELVFVIVVIGILAAVALPKFGSTMEQAQISSAKADVMALRSSILNERQKRLMRGTNNFMTTLSNGGSAPSADGDPIFNGDGTNTLFTYAKRAKKSGGSYVSGHWYRSSVAATTIPATETYSFIVDATPVVFTYNNADGTFTCVRSTAYCTQITE